MAQPGALGGCRRSSSLASRRESRCLGHYTGFPKMKIPEPASPQAEPASAKTVEEESTFTFWTPPKVENYGSDMGEFLCIGDYVCLYCEETEGYVYSLQSCSTYNGLNVYCRQDRNKPNNIANPHAVTFQVCIQNRYKLNKKFRKYQNSVDREYDQDMETKALLAQAKAAADAENIDNIAEQRRQQGKRVRYGEIIQLKHLFTGKFIHVNTTQTSKRDKNNMLVSLQDYNAKHGQFRILPRYKVKSEGEVIQIFDQVVLESIKSPGHFMHASAPYQIDYLTFGSELNLGVEAAGFTVIKNYSPRIEHLNFVRGGVFISLFHKELEAYIVAEGLFKECVTEQVHLRIREIDQLNPKTLSPSTSAITYWEIEQENSVISGDVLLWEHQVRFRHICTRQYLCISSEMKVTLTDDVDDPRTVFRFHPVVKEGDEILFESYARIENVLTGYWLHALKDEEYKRQQFQGAETDTSMRGLRWDGAELRKLSASGERMYDDAFTIQKIEEVHGTAFNFASGMVPFLFNLVRDRQEGRYLNAKKTYKVLTALKELKIFLIVEGEANKNRQKLLRNLRIIDFLVKLLQYPLRGVPDELNLTKVFKEAYDVLYTYMIGNSRKNALYFAKYIDFFQTQFSVKGDIGLNVAQMIVELVRDNRKIVDRITKDQMDQFVDLLRENLNYRYLDLLRVLCVCDGIAIPDNQSYIVQRWLMKDKQNARMTVDMTPTPPDSALLKNAAATRGLYLTERGQNIHKTPNICYVSTDRGKNWAPLHEFVDKGNPNFSQDEYTFLIHQLDLFAALCYGRNDLCIQLITRQLSYLSWEEVFLCVQSEILPDAIRAKYCELIIGLFVNVGNNYSVLDNPNISFIYEYVGTKDAAKSQDASSAPRDLVTIFPVLRDWIAEFLDNNKGMTASEIGHNMLIAEVLRLLSYLVQFGYYGDVEDVKDLLRPLLSLLDGRHDVPFPKDKDKGKGGVTAGVLKTPKTPGYSKDASKLVSKYRAGERYDVAPETKAIVDAKCRAMEVLDLLLTYQSNTRLEAFVRKFKQCEVSADFKSKNQNILLPAIYSNYNAFETKKGAIKKQKLMVRELKEMFEDSAYIDGEQITHILLDLSNYKYDKMVQQSLGLLTKFYSSKTNLFKTAVRAQVLITTDSCKTHREVARQMPIMRMLARQKLNDRQCERMEVILDEFIEMCHLPKVPEERHPMNQSILVTHDVLRVLFEILSQEIDVVTMDRYPGMENIFRMSLKLLQYLTRGFDLVQRRVFDRLDGLLRVSLAKPELSLALKEVFIGNQNTCLKILPRQIQKIVGIASELREKAPGFIDLLNVIAKVEGHGLALKRNQTLVMKYIMQNYAKAAYVLDQPWEMREKMLTYQGEPAHLHYLVGLIDLLATCAEGENRFIESLCQTILSLEEVLVVLNHPRIELNLKKPYLRYLLWVYMRTAGSVIESGAGDLPHDTSVWSYIQKITDEAKKLTEFIDAMDLEKVGRLLQQPPPKITGGKQDQVILSPSSDGDVNIHSDTCVLLCTCDSGSRTSLGTMSTSMEDTQDAETTAHAALHYFYEAVMPFLETFFDKFYQPDPDLYQGEEEFVNNLTTALVNLNEAVCPVMVNPEYLKTMISSLTTIIPLSDTPNSAMENIVEKIGTRRNFEDTTAQIKLGNMNYYANELDLNAKLRTFAVNCSLLYGGHNTVSAQMKYRSKREYTTIGGDEDLPLGEEFQSHLKCFIRSSEKQVEEKYRLCDKLIHQLEISAKNRRVSAYSADEEALDVRCLQLLRACIHNEERKLPEDWQNRTQERKIRKGVKIIRDIQACINNFGVALKVLPHLARPSDDITREVLALLCSLLFNANRDVQSSLLKYFLTSREEVFFYAIRNRMQLSVGAIKEKRLLQAQREARQKQNEEQARNLECSMTLGRKAFQQIRAFETAMRVEEIKRGAAVNLLPVLNQYETEISHYRSCKDYGSQKFNLSAIKVKKKKPEKKQKKPKMRKKKKVVKDVRFSNGKMTDGQALIANKEEGLPLDEMEMDVKVDGDASPDIEGEEVPDKEEPPEAKDDGYIALVLKVLARVCDGQHRGLQDYLREQPDNVKSFNIVAETAQYLNALYSNINADTIDLAIQLFNTLNEFCAGNQENRAAVYDNKVIDYINFILRAGDFQGCTPEQVLELRQVESALVLTLIEENGPEALQVAKEVKDALDKEAVYRCMTECYEMHQSEKPRFDHLVKSSRVDNTDGAKRGGGGYLKSAKSLAKVGSSFLKGMVDKKAQGEMKEALMECGYTFYLILARLYDIDPNMGKKGAHDPYGKAGLVLGLLRLSTEEIHISLEQQVAFKYYKKNCMSIEILKDDHLQKINFRVKNKNVMREEVKERMKWSVDRSSPSNKIRDFMDWSKDILKDIYYQRKVLGNPLALFFTKFWLTWNHLATLLSVAINVVMLVTWKAKASLLTTDIPENATNIPELIYDPEPEIRIIPKEQYLIIRYVLGGAHNLFSLFVLLSYFVSNHPRLPSPTLWAKKIRRALKRRKKDSEAFEEDEDEEETSKLAVNFLSFKTFYYVIFLAMSLAGTCFNGYFFAFHLLNIVNNNQLLAGVIQAVTQNGKSLLWVGVLGMVVFYLYAVVGFALFRSTFSPDSSMYCDDLWQCTVTVIRFGLIGDLFEVPRFVNGTNTVMSQKLYEIMVQHPKEATFARFGWIVLYHVSFFIFITTIGLNIIFGIIVDTFSELRDLKWTAESDMRDTCFICSRNSYDFEHHGSGFDLHVRAEHNMWAYIFFFIHLDDTKHNDYTSLELHVYTLLQQQKFDFFPLNRALCLSGKDEDSTDSKIDELLFHVKTLIQRQKEEESEKKRNAERLKQKQWQERHRNVLSRRRSSRRPDDGPPGPGGPGGGGGPRPGPGGGPGGMGGMGGVGSGGPGDTADLLQRMLSEPGTPRPWLVRQPSITGKSPMGPGATIGAPPKKTEKTPYGDHSDSGESDYFLDQPLDEEEEEDLEDEETEDEGQDDDKGARVVSPRHHHSRSRSPSPAPPQWPEEGDGPPSPVPSDENFHLLPVDDDDDDDEEFSEDESIADSDLSDGSGEGRGSYNVTREEPPEKPETHL
ncbi:inositol 1,4,5-trisphosphate receptor type 1-like isoform X9 [Lineus longissimus]|uniref:inositol 1,4,5-trisphosphate receptor type 1-like isoform X9 n=1 Tax=Lineus longissimus TaxID=88925 RepID=UPI00315DF5E8